MTGSEMLHISLLYVCFVSASIAMALLWRSFKKQSRLTGELLHELGVTYEGQSAQWETRQREMERITSELLLARDQQDSLLGRNISNRSMRKEALDLLRGGVQPDAVSSRLELPRNEVRLLAKVQALLTNPASAG